jgi:hypothetical protein
MNILENYFKTLPSEFLRLIKAYAFCGFETRTKPMIRIVQADLDSDNRRNAVLAIQMITKMWNSGEFHLHDEFDQVPPIPLYDRD